VPRKTSTNRLIHASCTDKPLPWSVSQLEVVWLHGRSHQTLERCIIVVSSGVDVVYPIETIVLLSPVKCTIVALGFRQPSAVVHDRHRCCGELTTSLKCFPQKMASLISTVTAAVSTSAIVDGEPKSLITRGWRGPSVRLEFIYCPANGAGFSLIVCGETVGLVVGIRRLPQCM
jgi:hypothetical protein